MKIFLDANVLGSVLNKEYPMLPILPGFGAD